MSFKKTRTKTRNLMALGALLAALHAHQALASFGDSRDSIDRDMAALKGSKHESVQKPNYTIEKITTPQGVVNEYVTAKDVVFAITWQGSSHPDLTPLLGSYFEEYRAGQAKHHARYKHRREKFKTTNMQFERGGHMRRVAGRIFSASLAPQGVTINEIR